MSTWHRLLTAGLLAVAGTLAVLIPPYWPVGALAILAAIALLVWTGLALGSSLSPPVETYPPPSASALLASPSGYSSPSPAIANMHQPPPRPGRMMARCGVCGGRYDAELGSCGNCR